MDTKRKGGVMAPLIARLIDLAEVNTRLSMRLDDLESRNKELEARVAGPEVDPSKDEQIVLLRAQRDEAERKVKDLLLRCRVEAEELQNLRNKLEAAVVVTQPSGGLMPLWQAQVKLDLAYAFDLRGMHNILARAILARRKSYKEEKIAWIKVLRDSPRRAEDGHARLNWGLREAKFFVDLAGVEAMEYVPDQHRLLDKIIEEAAYGSGAFEIELNTFLRTRAKELKAELVAKGFHDNDGYW